MKRVWSAVLELVVIWSGLMAWGDGVALDDPCGIFRGVSTGGAAAIAAPVMTLVPFGSECLHDKENHLDYELVFLPTMKSLEGVDVMCDGFEVQTNGLLRLTAEGRDWAWGYSWLEAPPLMWGELFASASVHRCAGGVQTLCYACGRRHGDDDASTCSHSVDCAARTDYASACTCPPLLVRINWDDDDGSWMEDRSDDALEAYDDEVVAFRAAGFSRDCCCGYRMSEGAIEGLTATSSLRLHASTEAVETFGIEAPAASSGIGTESVSYEVRDATNGVLRTIMRAVTAANLEIRPDLNDDGEVDEEDRFGWWHEDTWQVRVRDEPYLVALVSECPESAAVTLSGTVVAGTAPSVRSQGQEGSALPLGESVRSPSFAVKNATRIFEVDTSAGPGTVNLTYALEAGDSTLSSFRRIRAVDTSVPERWTAPECVGRLVYDYTDVIGDVWWSIYNAETGEYEVGGTDKSFSPGELPLGDYVLEVYFPDIVDDGWWGYLSLGELHVVSISHGVLLETNNSSNRIFNPTYKDDYTGNELVREVVEENGRLATYGAPRNNLYVVADGRTSKLEVTERLVVTPASAAEHVLCAAYSDGQLIVGSCTNANHLGEAVLSIPCQNPREAYAYEIRAGLDQDGDGILSFDESRPLVAYESGNEPRYVMVRGVPVAVYDSCEDQIAGYVSGLVGMLTNLALPIGRCFLSAFYNGNTSGIPQIWQPSESNREDELLAFSDCVGFSEWLTHNAGADFNENDSAMIKRYVWWPNTSMSEFFASCSPFAPWKKHQGTRVGIDGMTMETYEFYVMTETGNRILSYFESELKSLAEQRLRDAGDGDTCVFSLGEGWDSWGMVTNLFSSMSPSNIVGITQTVGSTGDYGGIGAVLEAGSLDLILGGQNLADLDAFFSLGRARILDPSYEITAVKRVPLFGSARVELLEVAFSCTVADLYDFNYEDGDLSRSAAVVQLGYGNGRSSRRRGKIYRHEIRIDTVYRNPYSN